MSVAGELARRLIAHESDRLDAPDAETSAPRLACERLCRNLARWVGTAGCNALFARALAQTQPAHPLLMGVRIDAGNDASFEGIIELVEEHGAPAVDAALESLIVAALGLLGRLIGDDVTSQILWQTPAATRYAD